MLHSCPVATCRSAPLAGNLERGLKEPSIAMLVEMGLLLRPHDRQHFLWELYV